MAGAAPGNLKGRFKFRVLSRKTPPPGGNQAGFNGDYNDIVVTPDGRAHPTWSDTRVRVPDPGFDGSSVDEDVYITSAANPISTTRGAPRARRPLRVRVCV